VEDDAQQEQILKEKFRKFWMTSVADGFKDDLEEIRKVGDPLCSAV
jgi:ribosome assembly protein 3